MNHIREGAIEYGSNDQSGGRSQQPSIGNEDAVLLQRAQHVAPAWHRLTHSEAEEGEGYFGGDIPRNQQRRLREQQAKDIGQDVSPQQVEIGSAKPTRRENIITISRAEYHPPHHPCWAGPADQSDHARQQEERAEGTQM